MFTMHCCICNVIVIVKICNFDTFVSLYVRQSPGPVQSMCDTKQPVAALLSLLPQAIRQTVQRTGGLPHIV